MRYVHVIFILFIAFGILGCTTQSTPQPNTTEITQDEISEEDEELFDDFEDETEIQEVYDPFEPYNRAMTKFNDNLYTYVVNPVATGYASVVHVEVRRGVDRFFQNLFYPVRFVNNLLQGKFKNASEETGRFVINTTIGVLGFFDPAKKYFHLEAHNEDFGQTLGFYGVGAGPHIVLPFLGPSNLRDTLSIYPDSYLSPIDYQDSEWYTITDTIPEYLLVKTFQKVNETSLHLGEYEKLKESSIDLYPFLRDVYEQYRNKQIQE